MISAAPVMDHQPATGPAQWLALAEWFFWLFVAVTAILLIHCMTRWAASLQDRHLSQPILVKFDLTTDLARSRATLTEDSDRQWWDSVQTLAVMPTPKEQP